MKKSKSGDIKVNLFYIASVLFYLAAILTFIFGDDTGTSVIWLWISLGSAFLWIGSAVKMKSQKDDDDKSK